MITDRKKTGRYDITGTIMVHQEGLFEEETTKLKLRQCGMDTCYVKIIPGLKEQWGPIL